MPAHRGQDSTTRNPAFSRCFTWLSGGAVNLGISIASIWKD